MKIDDLQEKVTRYLAETYKRRRFEKKHADVFAEWRKLEKAEKASLELAKASAREHATPGKTVVPIETPEVRVMVIGGYEGVSYDPMLARENWGNSFLRTIAIDAKRVAAMIELEQLSSEVAAKAEREQVPLEPRVKIEVLGK